MLVEVQEGGFNIVWDRNRQNEEQRQCRKSEREYRTSEWDAKRKGVRQPTSASRRPNGRRRRKWLGFCSTDSSTPPSRCGILRFSAKDKEDISKPPTEEARESTLSCFAAHLSCLVSRLADSHRRVLWIIIIKLSSRLSFSPARMLMRHYCRSQGADGARKVVRQVAVSQRNFVRLTGWQRTLRKRLAYARTKA